MINIRKLRYFLKVAESASFSKAAFELGVSQPTLSLQVAALEAHLGSPLLLRAAHGVTVTDAGRVFYRHAQALVSQIELAEGAVRSLEGSSAQQVSLGLATCGAASTLALPLLRRVAAGDRGLRLRLNDNFAGTLSDLIATGRIDLALVYTAGPMVGVRARALFVEELFAIASPSTALEPGPDGRIALERLRDIPLVLPSHVHFLRTLIDKACIAAGFRPRVIAEIDSFPALVEAAGGGLGTTLLPRAALDRYGTELSVDGLGPEPLEATVSLCTSARLPTTTAIGAVGTMIEDFVRDALASGAWPGVRAHDT